MGRKASRDNNNIEAQPKKRKIKEKFLEERETKIIPLRPMNDKQRRYINLITEKDMVIATGFPGTSKTYIPVRLAANWFLEGKVDKIVLTRPNISNSKSIGYLKGDLEQKMSMWLLPVLSILEESLGKAATEIAIKAGNIQFIPLEFIKGLSIDDCVWICDEAEDLTEEEAKKIVTRQAKGSKLILAGDLQQSELKEKSGLRVLLDMAKYYENLNVGIIEFNDIEDIVRSEQCKNWIIAFSEDEMRKKGGK